MNTRLKSKGGARLDESARPPNGKPPFSHVIGGFNESVMKMSDLFGFLSGYSSRKILLAAAALAVSLIVKKFLKKRKLKKLAAALPFAVGVVLRLIYTLAVNADENFGNVIEDGASAGSIATVIYALITGFFKDPSDYEEVPLDSLIIEGLLAGYVPDGELKTAAEKIAAVLREDLPKDDEREKLISALKEVCPQISGAEAEFIVKIILNVLTATN